MDKGMHKRMDKQMHKQMDKGTDKQKNKRTLAFLELLVEVKKFERMQLSQNMYGIVFR